MDVSKELVRGCLLYNFKVGLSAAASSRQRCQAFGDSAVNERTARHWFQKFRPHVARVARNTTQRLGWETLGHPPYSLNLVPSDYHLFHSLDSYLRGKSFTNEADVHQALTDLFASHTPEFYYKGIEQLETRWQKVLDDDDDYFKD
ncbi:histone-lysine N-methyltransferase SETMAR [Trichonephila clavipes]|nr:histone-lysine N-methyltransferase SETMAR [Trichonephila clavipes]